MRKNNNEFGKEVKKRLIDMNMTQAELAKKLDTTPQYLCRILTGERSGIKYQNKIKGILKIDTVA